MYGLRGIFHSRLNLYVSDKNMFVCNQPVLTNLKPVETGVPLGSEISQVIFLVYIKDIP